MIAYHLIAITIAFILDIIIGDPLNWPHPVKWMGSYIAILEKWLNKGKHKGIKGFIMLFILIISILFIILPILWIGYSIHTFIGILIESILIMTTISQKSLRMAALDVLKPLTHNNLNEARIKLSYIVGRDTDSLSEEEIVRGTVETVAENTSDGITAPLFWGFIGGAPLALIYRCINTCDSMVGYKNERYKDFGFASAKLDDCVNWIPSRITGVILLLSQKPEYLSYKAAFTILLRDAKKHPSPNSGWGEAAIAASLGIQLGGINYYIGVKSNRARMGDPLVNLNQIHILKTVKIMHIACFFYLLLLWIGGVMFEITKAWI
ncbi:adenosylcobinamide-phosphate synthase [Bacillus pakistanensis]|uniref:Cobalamin biosynthesis protein CobD n=1 Tax=Rossellomorea pakistanensis TaxID=992288 RepID=A0ABS2N7K2_9BACI|nr:adenosylcobinamide-phosphate synthase CbiB [Bacillus pakistanensis]MBM7583835.1 adenosylcobinamide-phosphate synthase [Bacillus pakistanensis]